MNERTPLHRIVSAACPLLLLALLSVLAPVQAYALSEEEKITLLIESARDTPEGTRFIRNGSAYGVADAVSHLARKYSRAQSRVKTAEEFILHVASRSSISGKEYLIQYPDGTTVTTATFFMEKLHSLE